jgi:hypothetical protein
MTQVYNSNLIGVKQSVVDEILLLNPNQTPMISLLGFAQAVTQVTHQWFEDELYSDESKVNGVVTNVATSVTVVDGTPFRVGHVIKIVDELLFVSAVAGNVLTVTRGYASTTAASIADQAKIEVLFVEGAEGADARAARYKQRVQKSNNTQIFDDTIQISGSAQAVQQYGVTDLYGYEKVKKQLEKALELEKAVINGIAYTNGQVRQMKGMRSFIGSNVTALASVALTADHINDLLQKIFEAGGFASGGNYKIIVPAKQKRAVSNLTSANIRLTQSETERGVSVDRFVSDFGKFDVQLNNNLNADEMFIIDANRAFIRPLNGREFFHKYMGEKGDYTTGIVVGEYTLEFREEKAHARIKGLL